MTGHANRAHYAVLDLLEPGHARSEHPTIAPTGTPPERRQIAFVPHPADRLMYRYEQSIGSIGNLAELMTWTEEVRSDDMTKTMVEWMGLAWYRTRIDDVLFHLGNMSLVVRDDRVGQVRQALGADVPLPDSTLATVRTALDPADRTRFADLVVSRNAVDMLLFDLAGFLTDVTASSGALEARHGVES